MQSQRNGAPASRAPRSSDDHAYSVMNTVRALERLAAGPLSVPELAAELRIGERSARRLVQRLAAEGYVEQGAGRHRRYSATLRLLSVARALLDHARLPQVALPRLQRLAVSTWARAQLWVPAAGGAVCLLDVDGRLCWPAAHPFLGTVHHEDDHLPCRALSGEELTADDLVAVVDDGGRPAGAVALAFDAPPCAEASVLARYVRLTAAEIGADLSDRVHR